MVLISNSFILGCLARSDRRASFHNCLGEMSKSENVHCERLMAEWIIGKPWQNHVLNSKLPLWLPLPRSHITKLTLSFTSLAVPKPPLMINDHLRAQRSALASSHGEVAKCRERSLGICSGNTAAASRAFSKFEEHLGPTT